MKRSHFLLFFQIINDFISNMEWSVSDDVNDDVMALPGPAIVGPLLFLQGEILFSKKILQKLHRHDTHTADREELFFRHCHKVS